MEYPSPIPHNQQILSAERLRMQGKLTDAAAEMRLGSDIARRFPTLHNDDQTRVMMASRIFTDSQIGLARQSPDAEAAATRLGEARHIIVYIYQNPAVAVVAQATRQDVFGNPYEFSVEMARDQAKYLVTLSQLTGNMIFLSRAIDMLGVAAEQANEDTVKTLARFEQAELRYQQGHSPNNFRRIKRAFKEAVQSSQRIGRWERVATIGSRYAITAFQKGRLLQAAKGIRAWANAAWHDRNTVSILTREVKKKAATKRRQREWLQTTPPNVFYEDLAI